MNNVVVFKTDLDDQSKAKNILDEIRRVFPGSDPSFDLEDCDKVLRIEEPGSGISQEQIKTILNTHGYQISVLPT